MKNLIIPALVCLLFFFSAKLNAQSTVHMENMPAAAPPPPNNSAFGADGPGAPSDTPASNIDSYIYYALGIGALIVVKYRKKIFKLPNAEENNEDHSDDY